MKKQTILHQREEGYLHKPNPGNRPNTGNRSSCINVKKGIYTSKILEIDKGFFTRLQMSQPHLKEMSLSRPGNMYASSVNAQPDISSKRYSSSQEEISGMCLKSDVNVVTELDVYGTSTRKSSSQHRAPCIVQYCWKGMSIDEKLAEITRRRIEWRETRSGL